MSEDDKAEDAAEARHQKTLADIQVELHKLVEDIAKLQSK
jgi:hypothetical protein